MKKFRISIIGVMAVSATTFISCGEGDRSIKAPPSTTGTKPTGGSQPDTAVLRNSGDTIIRLPRVESAQPKSGD